MSIYNQSGTGGYKNRFVESQKNLIKRNFDKSDGFGIYKVYRLGEYTLEDFPIHIFITRTDGRRKFVSHPDYPVLKGDIIEYTEDGNSYLVFAQDTHSGVNNFGEMYRMENTISIKNEFGDIDVIPYYMTNNGIGSQDNNNIVSVSNTRKEIYVQWNDLSKSIYKNQRFILGNIEAYKITSRDNFSVKGLLKLTLESTQILAQDDLINNVAHNTTEPISPPIQGKTGVFYSNTELSIPVGLSKSVSVNEYLNDVIIPSTLFTFRIDGIDSSKYQIVVQDGNSIEIKALDDYFVGELVAIENVGLVEYKIPLTLKSAFG